MSAKNVKNSYQSLTALSKGNGANIGDISTLKPVGTIKQEIETPANLGNPSQKIKEVDLPNELHPRLSHTIEAGAQPKKIIEKSPAVALSFAEAQKQRKLNKAVEKDEKLLSHDRWLARNGHTLTYVGLFLFTLVVYFRPYEWVPGLENFTSIALIFAILTLVAYLPTQLSTEGSITILTTEVKCILFLVFWSLLTMPMAKDPALAWKIFNETFIKILIIFVVMVNTLRTKERLNGLMWLSLGVGVWLSYQAVVLYQAGEFAAEGYRVGVKYGGMFGNPNDLAMHLVMVTPIAFVFGMATKNPFSRILYFGMTFLLVIGNMVTQSRGAFLALITVAGVFVWKLGKKQRFKVILLSAVAGLLFMVVAPGDYGKRVLSIFVPSLDPVGSSDQRKELLQLSLIVTLRNPLGIGLGNFTVVGIKNLQTHNAYTQVSSELGWLAFVAYIIFIVSPLRKLGAIERQLFANEETTWLYYMAIGVQGSIVAYMVASFFGAVAYNWFIYYPIAYAICLRRIYRVSQIEKGIEIESEKRLSDYFKLQKAEV